MLSDRQSEIFDDPATPVGGNPHGDVTIVEFFDYRCPYCKQVQPALQALLDQDHKLRFIYKEMPVLGPASVLAARAALAARRQGKYEAFHAAMMGTKGQISEDTVDKIAESVGPRCQLAQTRHGRSRDSANSEGQCCARPRAKYSRNAWLHYRQSHRRWRRSQPRHLEEYDRCRPEILVQRVGLLGKAQHLRARERILATWTLRRRVGTLDQSDYHTPWHSPAVIGGRGWRLEGRDFSLSRIIALSY